MRAIRPGRLRAAPAPHPTFDTGHVVDFFIALLALALACAAGPAVAEDGGAPEWQSLLERIVDINSGTRNVDGLEAVREVLIPEFEKLGLEADVHDLADGHKLLAMAVPGGAPELLLMGHIDTVFPRDSAFQTFEAKGERIYGPGIIDMKAGIVVILELLKGLEGTGRLEKVLVLLNDDEEIGSPYSQALVKDLVAGIGMGLVFEPGLPGGAVVTSQSGVRWLTLSVQGKAAHAGLEPEKGLNACVELGHKVVEISKLTDFSRKLTLNVGVIAGGTEPNVVCERAEARIDMRFVEREDETAALGKIQDIADRQFVTNDRLGAGTSATLETFVAIPSLPESRTERLYGLLEIAGKRIGQEVAGSHVGFVSDANQLADTGMELLVGLGPYGEGMHTDSEYLAVSTFDARLELTEALIMEILK